VVVRGWPRAWAARELARSFAVRAQRGRLFALVAVYAGVLRSGLM